MSNSTSLSHPPKPLTILHTSDWHLGRRLYGQLRYHEFEAFLAWLTQTLQQYEVDVLIVAGDVFDTMTPSNKAQALYYEFLGVVSKSHCDHVVVVAGNHDSPTFLDAPANVLKALNVHVIGTACEDVADEVLVLTDSQDKAQCVIAAVPYLRDRDVRSAQAGESGADKDANLLAGIHEHYAKVAQVAKAKQAKLITQQQRHIPLIATGHLFAAGGATTADDGVRELYVGSLGKISADMFDECFDYVALGHLHVPQKVGGREHIRYSGSPIAMGFGEANQTKQVLLVQFGQNLASDSLKERVQEHIKERIEEASTAPQIPTAPQISAKPSHTLTTPAAGAAANSSQADLFCGDLFDDWLEPTLNQPSQLQTHADSAADSISQLDKQHKPDEALAAKTLHITADNTMQIIAVTVPCFQQLLPISGDINHILQSLQQLPHTKPIWIEVAYTGDEIVSDLREQIHAAVAGTPFEVLKIKNHQVRNKVLKAQSTHETLQDLDEMQVFERCLVANKVAESQRPSLREAYAQIVYQIHHDDSMAE